MPNTILWLPMIPSEQTGRCDLPQTQHSQKSANTHHCHNNERVGRGPACYILSISIDAKFKKALHDTFHGQIQTQHQEKILQTLTESRKSWDTGKHFNFPPWEREILLQPPKTQDLQQIY